MTVSKWALLDEEGEPVRFFTFPSEGTVLWPPPPKTLDIHDPEWYNIPF